VIMGLENVVSDILKSAKAEVSVIEADRDGEVSSIIEEAKRTGERITGEKVASAEEEATRIRKQEISGANLEVRRMMLNTRKEILDETQKQTAERLHELDTESLLRSLVQAHSGDATRVYSSRQDQPIVERLCDELLEAKLTKLEYAGNIETSSLADMILVLSIGGSVIDHDRDRLTEYAKVLRDLRSDHTVFVVVGGGATARGYIGMARTFDADETFCDLLGIAVTRLNARLLIAALGSAAYPVPPETQEDANVAALSGRIVVMGGTTPGHTTDAVAAILAEYVHADILIDATSTDGIYTKDPKKHPDAVKLDELSPARLVEIIAADRMVAGANLPLDMLAAKIIERSGILTVVLDGRAPMHVVDAVNGEQVGTRVR